jgi:hypothetical protein
MVAKNLRRLVSIKDCKKSPTKPKSGGATKPTWGDGIHRPQITKAEEGGSLMTWRIALNQKFASRSPSVLNAKW